MKKIKEELKQFSQKSKKSQSKLTDKLRELEINVDLLESERDALDKYFEFLKDIEKKGKVVRGCKIKDDYWGGLLIDVPRLLNSFEVNAFRGGKLIYEAQGDQSTVDLLTKRFNPKKIYSLNSVKIF